MISRNQIDHLGSRLAKGSLAPADLRELDEYRRSFDAAYQEVVRILRDELRLSPTGRPAKSTPAIIEKLKRETIRLSQMQDIAGCRVVVDDAVTQDEVISVIVDSFSGASVIDRRKIPSHGYRAVHIIIPWQDRLVEVQVRTALQHSWAELSEKLADRIGQSIKYGIGDEMVLALLRSFSDGIGLIEEHELSIETTKQYVHDSPEEGRAALSDLNTQLANVRRALRESIENSTARLV